MQQVVLMRFLMSALQTGEESSESKLKKKKLQQQVCWRATCMLTWPLQMGMAAPMRTRSTVLLRMGPARLPGSHLCFGSQTSCPNLPPCLSCACRTVQSPMRPLWMLPLQEALMAQMKAQQAAFLQSQEEPEAMEEAADEAAVPSEAAGSSAPEAAWPLLQLLQGRCAFCGMGSEQRPLGPLVSWLRVLQAPGILAAVS